MKTSKQYPVDGFNCIESWKMSEEPNQTTELIKKIRVKSKSQFLSMRDTITIRGNMYKKMGSLYRQRILIPIERLDPEVRSRFSDDTTGVYINFYFAIYALV